ncbi:MAG: type II secretion system F family protein [Candidatus Saccharimonadales bacterium]
MVNGQWSELSERLERLVLTYQYVARNPSTGARIKANVEAQSEQDAARVIKKEGLTPIEIKLTGSKLLNGPLKKLSRVRAKDRVLFARQLSTLINAGLPLAQSLRSVNDQTTSKPLKIVISDLTVQIEGGTALSVALASHPNVFDKVFISLVAAGETSGTLDTALERIAIQQEKDADILSKVRGALTYPAIVVLIMIAVVVFMLVKVLPQVKVLYKTFPGAKLPIETRALLGLSYFVIHYWWVVLIIVIVLGFLLKRYLSTKSGHRAFDTIKLRMPPLSNLFKKVYMARFARTGSTLVVAGVPLLQVLQITSDAVSNVLVEDSIKKAADKVKGGKALSDSLTNDPNFLPLVPNMLRIGEQSGSMEKMMAKTAEYYEKEVDSAIKNISTIIEPIMMVLLGIMALIIVAAVLLPVYSLAGSGNIRF